MTSGFRDSSRLLRVRRVSHKLHLAIGLSSLVDTEKEMSLKLSPFSATSASTWRKGRVCESPLGTASLLGNTLRIELIDNSERDQVGLYLRVIAAAPAAVARDFKGLEAISNVGTGIHSGINHGGQRELSRYGEIPYSSSSAKG